MAKDGKNKRVLIHAGIAMLQGRDVLKYISNKQYEDVKEKDKHPMFVLMSTAHEGEANGQLYANMSSGAKAKKWFKQLWPLRAIKELVAHFLDNGKTPVFTAHEIGADHRYVVGNIIASTKEVINHITHALGVAHIFDFDTKRAIERGDFDSCSIEAECWFRETNQPMQFEVESVDSVSGVALCNTRTAPPAFRQANILAVVAAMAEANTHRQGVSNMAEGDKVVTFRDIQDYIKEHRTAPEALFSVEEMTKVQAVKSAFETDFEAKTKALKEEKVRLEEEIIPFKKAAKQAAVAKHIRESEVLKDEPKATVEYLTKTMSIDISETEKPQEVVDKAVKEQLAVMKSSGIKFGEKTDESGNEEEGGGGGSGDDDKSAENKNKSSGTDYTDPKNNDLIPQEEKD